VKLSEWELGVGAKIGLTVMLVLVGGMIFGLLCEIGHGQYIWNGIWGGILIYIWLKPGNKAKNNARQASSVL
jgi:hypothetical protein